MTRAEQNLVALGESSAVATMRRVLHTAMREEASAIVEEVLERRVVSYMSDVDTQADMALMAFVLEPETGF